MKEPLKEIEAHGTASMVAWSHQVQWALNTLIRERNESLSELAKECTTWIPSSPCDWKVTKEEALKGIIVDFHVWDTAWSSELSTRARKSFLEKVEKLENLLKCDHE